MGKNKLQKIFNIITLITTVLLIAFIIYAFKLGILEDKNILIQYMKKFGISIIKLIQIIIKQLLRLRELELKEIQVQ